MTKRSISLKLLGLIALATSFALPTTTLAQAKKKASPHAAVIAVAKRTVSEEFKDPKSAQFRSIVVYPGGSGMKAVCGEVNAKNSFGAYVGFDAFYVLVTPAPNSEGLMPQTGELATMMCEKYVSGELPAKND